MTPEQKRLNGILLNLHTTARAKNREAFLDALGELDVFPNDVDFEIRYVHNDGAKVIMFHMAGMGSNFVTRVNDSTDPELLARYETIYQESHDESFWDVFKTEYDMTEDEFQWVIGGL